MNTRQPLIIMTIIVLAIMVTLAAANAEDFLVSENLGQSAYTASTFWSVDFPYLAFDGDTTNTMWNVGGYGGWIEVNLGRVYDLSKISAVCYPHGGTLENCVWYSMNPIGVGSADLACTLEGTGTTFASDFAYGTLAQYVQVQTTIADGWTNWYEIQIYARPGVLQGKVTSGDPGNPAVEGATVESLDGKYSTKTAADGTYTLPVPAGVGVFSATKDGYLRAASNLTVSADTTTSQDFKLLPNASVSVTGTIHTNEANFPTVAGVTISADNGAYTAVSDNNGNYSLPLPSGNYTITASKNGYIDTVKDITVDASNPSIVNLTIKSATMAVISGTIKSSEEGNSALAGVVVSSSDGKYSTKTAADGTYRLVVDPSIVSIYVTYAGYITDCSDMSLTAQQELNGLDFVMEPGIILSQGLTASSYTASQEVGGCPAPRAFDGNIATQWTAPANASWLEVDLGQNYSIAKVLLWVDQNPSGYETTHNLWTSSSVIGDTRTGATLANTFQKITYLNEILSFNFPSGSSAQHVQINTIANPGWNSWFEMQVFGYEGSVAGTVSSSANGLPAVAGVTVKTSDGKYSTVTDENGKYSMTVPAGNLKLIATKDGYADSYMPAVVEANKTTTQDFDLKNLFTVAKISDLKTIADGSEVEITNPMAATVSSTTFTDGSYYIEEADRSMGIKVVPSTGLPTVNLGDRANYAGVLSKDSSTGERFISVNAIDNQTTGDIIRTLGMSNKAIAGAGISPDGLLIKTWGKVLSAAQDESYMYIDDGSNVNSSNGNTGIKVVLSGTNDLNLPSAAKVGESVSVTGVVGHDADGIVMKPRSSVDIVNNADEHVVVHASEFGAPGDGSTNNWKIQNYGLDNGGTTQSTITFVDNGINFYHASSHDVGVGLRCSMYSGLLLSQLTELSFAELVNALPAACPNRTMLVALNVDTNDDGTYDEILYYEPYYHQLNALGGVPRTWQVWDALHGLWSCYDVNGNTVNGMTRETPKTLADYLTVHPNAKLDASANGGLRFYTGVLDYGLCGGFACTLGNVTVGTASGTIVYSFAPDTAAL